MITTVLQLTDLPLCIISSSVDSFYCSFYLSYSIVNLCLVFIFSNFLLNFSLCSFSPDWLGIFMIINCFDFSTGILHILTLISSFLRFCHVHLEHTPPSSRLAEISVSLCVLGQLVVLSDCTGPGGVAWGPAAHPCVVAGSQCPQTALCRLRGIFCCGGTDRARCSGGCSQPG